MDCFTLEGDVDMNKLDANELCVLIPNHLVAGEDELDPVVISLIKSLAKIGWSPSDFGEDNGNCTELWFNLQSIKNARQRGAAFIDLNGWV